MSNAKPLTPAKRGDNYDKQGGKGISAKQSRRSRKKVLHGVAVMQRGLV